MFIAIRNPIISSSKNLGLISKRVKETAFHNACLVYIDLKHTEVLIWSSNSFNYITN
jgi:hypothetical protein